MPEDDTPDEAAGDLSRGGSVLSANSVIESSHSGDYDSGAGDAVSDTTEDGRGLLVTRFTGNDLTAVNDSPQTEPISSRVRMGGVFSATSFSELGRSPPVDRARGSVEPSRQLTEASTATRRVPVRLSRTVGEHFEHVEPARSVVPNMRRTMNHETAQVSVSCDPWHTVPPANDDGPHYSQDWSGYNMPRPPPGPQPGGLADISAVLSTWAPEPPGHDDNADIDSWDTDLVLLASAPNHSDLGATARHAARLLDAFSTGGTPPAAGALTSIQQRLLSAALTAILTITSDHRVDAAAQTDPAPSAVDSAAQTDPAPILVNLAMRPDSTCVVCFLRLADTVLAPCWHLALCTVGGWSVAERGMSCVLLMRGE